MDEHMPFPEMSGGPFPPGPPGPPHANVQLPDLDWEHMTLDWAQYADKWELSEDGTYYSLQFVYFATNILSREHQYMNIYVPAAYLNADGTVSKSGTCRGYTAETAPIVLHNNCGGWRSSVPADLPGSYMQEGFVFGASGARSRGLPDGVGKTPAPCVDLKAAVRMLRLHDQEIPGCKDRIVSCGGSGGGQMSSILGATGNMPYYYDGLYEIGAAGIEKAADGTLGSTIRDDIYASQCYCPIADINHADLAYAWQRYDDPNISFEDMGAAGKDLTPFQLALQEDLAQAWCAYVNSLNLTGFGGEKLHFDAAADGTFDARSGNYYESLLDQMALSLDRWMQDKVQPDGSLHYEVAMGPMEPKPVSFPSAEAYFASLKDTESWLSKDADGYHISDMKGFSTGTALKRGKSTPGFDTFHCTAENDAFGPRSEKAVHFSSAVGDVLSENYERYQKLPGFEEADVDAYIAQTRGEDIKDQTYHMNATSILLACAEGKEQADFAKFWRTRNGTADEHTSFCIAYNLLLAAKLAGAEVDYALIWTAGHGDVDGDGTGRFEDWVHEICKSAEA